MLKAPTRTSIHAIASLSSFALAVQEAMKNLSLNDEQLAQRIGSSKVTVTAWRLGRYTPRETWIKPLTKELGIDVKKLLKDSQKEAEPSTSLIVQNSGPRPKSSTIEGKPLLEFKILPNGVAQVKFDITLPVIAAMPLLRVLMDTANLTTKQED